MGEIDIFRSSEDDSESQSIVSQQPSGVLFKSQNGSTWTPNQFEDLTYVINKLKFKETNGTVRFYSPILSEDNNQIKRLRDNPLIMTSRQDSNWNNHHEIHSNILGDIEQVSE